MYSEQLRCLFADATHAGRLEQASHCGEAGTPGQGPYFRVWLEVSEGVVRVARFKTYGCPAAIACAEAACRWIEGRMATEARSLDAAALANLVGGVPEGKEHCPRLAAAALVCAVQAEP
jgi:nitrogen fixation NifU-like protein